MTNNELSLIKIFDFSNNYKTIDPRLNIWKAYFTKGMYNVLSSY